MDGLIIVGRKDLQEEYVAEIMHTEKQLTGPGLDPIVRILRILRYPAQHAIYFPTIPMSVSPVPGGTICRLPYIRDASDDEIRRFPNYGESLVAARHAYTKSCNSQKMRELCLNGWTTHIRKSLVTFNERDL